MNNLLESEKENVKDLSLDINHWLQIMLLRGGLLKEDIVSICKKTNLRFFKENSKEEDCEFSLSAEAMGIVLMNHNSEDDLQSIIEDMIKEKYPYKPDFQMSNKIFLGLIKKTEDELLEILKNISQNKPLINFFSEENFRKNAEGKIDWISESILEEVVKMSKGDLDKFLEEYIL